VDLSGGYRYNKILKKRPMECYRKDYLYKRIVKAKMYIDENFAEKLDLSAIADRASFSKYHFFRLFKEIYGVTPFTYLTALRIEKSKNLLAKDLTIFEVANLIGFESPTSFSAVFKKITKVSPSDYRLQVKRQRLQKKETPFSLIPNCFAYNWGWLKNSNIEEPFRE
jgi:AraC-like DNA-binding protein